jgi:sugar phosphate isomerase/epimerase
MIYISTGGFFYRNAYETSLEFLQNEIYNIELSGGLFDNSLILNLKRLSSKLNFQIHNYFPPPSKPFVFNLASLNPDISKRSFDHALNSIEIASDIGKGYYSFHAGFLLDLEVSELGKKIKKRTLNERSKAFQIFLDNINKLAKVAEEKGIELLIENNVISAGNYAEFKEDALLMTQAEECIQVMKSVPNNVKMLVDLAHLKVSSNSLNFDPIEFLSKCDEWISAYHLSDNDGTRDSNEPFSKDSWFWPYIKKDLNYYSIEVYTDDLSLLKNQKLFLERMLKS